MALVATSVLLLLVAPLLVIAAVGVLLVITAILPDRGRRVRETFECPVTGKAVTADFLVPDGAAHPGKVVWCTAFSNPERVRCTSPCREFADVRWGLSRAVFPRWALTAGGPVTWRNAA